VETVGNFYLYNVVFFGARFDAYGMPEPYHNYLVTIIPWEVAGAPKDYWLASVSATSGPLPEPRHFVARGDQSVALASVLEAVKRLRENSGLSVRLFQR
jgi:hypothetical protein